MTLADVRVIGFDAYGTLFDIAGIVDAVRPELGERADALFRLWRRRQVEISWLPLIHGGRADFWQVTDEALDFAMGSLGLDDSALRRRLMEGWMAPRPFPDAVAVLADLRGQGCSTAILSNGTERMLAAAVASGGMGGVLDAALSAERAGRFKPDGAVYRLLSSHFGFEPERVCFVSANPWDVNGAAAFGFQVVWIDREGLPEEKWPTGRTARVESLEELPRLLREAKDGRA